MNQAADAHWRCLRTPRHGPGADLQRIFHRANGRAYPRSSDFRRAAAAAQACGRLDPGESNLAGLQGDDGSVHPPFAGLREVRCTCAECGADLRGALRMVLAPAEISAARISRCTNAQRTPVAIFFDFPEAQREYAAKNATSFCRQVALPETFNKSPANALRSAPQASSAQRRSRLRATDSCTLKIL